MSLVVRIALIALILFQTASVAAAFWLPIGFDHPSELGLDFGHFTLLCLLYVLALIPGMVLTIWERPGTRGVWAFGQLAIPIVIVFLSPLIHGRLMS
jgi:hypothetical protein